MSGVKKSRKEMMEENTRRMEWWGDNAEKTRHQKYADYIFMMTNDKQRAEDYYYEVRHSYNFRRLIIETHKARLPFLVDEELNKLIDRLWAPYESDIRGMQRYYVGDSEERPLESLVIDAALNFKKRPRFRFE